MKQIKSIFIALLLFVAAANAQDIRIASYNLRYDNKGDSGNLWTSRYPIVSALIQFHDFDIFGTQEGLRHQIDTLAANLPGYAWYGQGRDDGQAKGEHSAIFYKTAKYKLLGKGDFWLSETPEKVGPGWDARLNRICSYVQLQDVKSKKKFYVFNVHYDHQGVKARQESSKLILEKIKTIAGTAPVLLTGDFNGDHNSQWYQLIANSGTLSDTYRLVAKPYANNGSFNSFKTPSSTSIIDHIFVTKQFSVKRWGILTDSYYGKFPSDHFPVVADVTLK
ncbi:endonuclease/exonuclease/phosphatase family protein [Paraflavitalea sp. CAU 1676]|uniref:endonuclease/exonuclease/phosphatase family protein n=1 Tax=Paraflavitalea sp. CAU 1676 TaxID=3032598 RepID=UPI0023DAE381|nr:endonuclease/exonuclease/phosphatase family protein [Paraflavitalea sp. CAU 1676]MDF2191107.1 endonuclease/exonuclease/phosphatase family protein [Paraflavitalea sp. CAU 1676]